ncbi:MAG: hypothetical protein KatS3mg087_0277 [Patescibacteria group bacterium]|nr:MAG: hypothetical protein KatS3mg087_0277 [Patescibacteria group bacterium]
MEIDEKIKKLNDLGLPVIFIVTGNNSAGKTTFTKKLLQNFDFYQSINLGIISKMIRFFRPDIDSSELENFDGNEASKIFKDLLDFIIDTYVKTGVNIVVEGVQIDTDELEKNDFILGGVVLEVDTNIAMKRGDKPATHFSRSIQEHHLKQVHYISNAKFKIVNNNGNSEQTFEEIMLHLNNILDMKLHEYEQN